MNGVGGARRQYAAEVHTDFGEENWGQSPAGRPKHIGGAIMYFKGVRWGH